MKENQREDKTSKLTRYLIAKRREAGLLQYELSAIFGYGSSQFISNWERGLSYPPTYIIGQLAKVFNVPAEELFEMILEDLVAAERKIWRENFEKTARSKPMRRQRVGLNNVER